MNQFKLSSLAAALAALSALSGCNLFSGIDKAKDDNERLANARAMFDQGDCDRASDALGGVVSRTDEFYHLSGWVQLCQGGATTNKILGTLLTYQTATNNLTVVGDLANNMIPSSQEKINSIKGAVATFKNMSSQAGSEKLADVVLADIVLAATIIAKSSPDGVSVKKTDIGDPACASTDCNTGGIGCTPASRTTISDSDANAVGDALIDASTTNGSVSKLGIAASLAASLGAGAQRGIALVNRCFIYQSMLAK